MARRGRKKKAAATEMTLTEIRKLYEQVALRERGRLPELKARQAELSTELETVNTEIAAIEGVVPVAAPAAKAAPARRGRPKRAAAKAPRAGRVKKVKAEAAKAAPKRRGRPPKAKAAKAEKPVPAKAEKKRMGRPRKVKAVAPAAGEAATPRRGRPRKEGGDLTLRQAIANVLSESTSPLAPSEIRDVIIQKKLISRITPSFHQQVTGTLSRNPEFKRIGKGKYSL
jgi:colicin import membrane protein